MLKIGEFVTILFMVKRICQQCGKRAITGATSRHKRGVASKKFSNRAKKVKRTLKPNLQSASLMIQGKKKKILLCTKCLRKLKKKSSSLVLKKSKKS
ncbi:hypothetical protein COT75_01230 [Candidatus Beckwithbacteria bacterium CG10_big_fil_rev_8_21_14_0_10_34_10]|uniref:50S ribosomal protein L28 n=1 Tax=Candidatus Beckwithbacteria bacterium CG10_big_fil_rev_8_21_14_0_10_34_10 TaxID=1974495 RepID=A0A2H0W9Z5_9BACT|nr:MAG: hypothetical protein COT75_01230 [Candidatus Beckwithbacteria bacterium CG10_big_fil_rev_8_21_14_0_10_34_10]